jgi:hypothetical protein
VDFAIFQRRIHSLLQADGTLPAQIRNGHHSLPQADGALSVHSLPLGAPVETFRRASIRPIPPARDVLLSRMAAAHLP